MVVLEQIAVSSTHILTLYDQNPLPAHLFCEYGCYVRRHDNLDGNPMHSCDLQID
jgi:hypothetical protein